MNGRGGCAYECGKREPEVVVEDVYWLQEKKTATENNQTSYVVSFKMPPAHKK